MHQHVNLAPECTITLQNLQPFDTVLLGGTRGIQPYDFMRGAQYYPFQPDDNAIYSKSTDRGGRLYFRNNDVIVFIGLRRIRMSSGFFGDDPCRIRVVVFLFRGRLYWTYRKEFDGMYMTILNHK